MQRPNFRRDAVVSNRMTRGCRAIAAAAGMLFAAHAGAAEISWIGAPGVPLNFGTGANWDGGAVPDAPDDAIINNGGIATVAPAFTRTVTDLRLGTGPAGSGGFTQTGGTINATGDVAFGEHTTGRGTLNFSGGTLNVGSGFLGNFSIGDDGAGTATISGGVINTRFAFLGRSTNGHGHVTQTGGTLTVERNLVMAELKPANLTAPQTPSDYTMSGGGISVGNEMYIGAHGPVTMNLSGTGSVSVVGALHIAASGALQDPPAGIGTLNMSGGTFNVTGANAFFVIGDGGAGTMNLSAGHITTGFFNTGQNFGAVGIVNHTGGAATANFAWTVGEESRGANVYDLSGGTVTVVGTGGLIPGDTNIGSGAGGKGTVIVRGTGVANTANDLRLGGANFAGGTLDVRGGTVAIGTNGAGTGKLLAGDTGTGTFIMSGGHLSTDLVTFGQNAGAVGTGTQTGGTFISRSNFTVGEASTGANAFDISGGTLAVGGGSLGGSIFVGSNGNGTFRVGGTANVTSTGALTVALAGTGTVAVTGGSLAAASMNNRGLYTQSGGVASLGVVSDTGSISVSGGTLTASSIAQGTLQISAGQVTIAPNGTSSGTSVVNNLDVSGTGKFNLTNNALVVPYSGASPLAAIRADIVSGYNGGAWNGNGIISSQANANQFGIGYAEANALTSIPAIFGTVAGDAVLVRFTRYGDANLDGTVSLQDFNRLAGSFGATGAVWSQGDFNYDGTVNLQDFNRLAANFGLSAAGASVTPDDWAALAAAVPEPTGGLAAASLVAAAALARRTRRSLPLV